MYIFFFNLYLSTFTGTHEPNKVDLLLILFGFITKLVEHCTVIAEVLGSNPVGATRIFQISARIVSLLDVVNI